MKSFTASLKKMAARKSALAEDILVGGAAILTGYFYYYENKKIISNIANPASVNHAVKIAVSLFIVAVWLYLSFCNGLKKRRSFLICTAVIWIIPQVVKFCSDTFDAGVYSGSLHRSFAVLIKYLSGINHLSLKTLGDAVNKAVGLPYAATLNIAVALFEFAFVLGFLLSAKPENP